MCGIGGFFGTGVAPERSRSILQGMVNAVEHRGPDDRGIFVGDGVGLGHTRLSIVDISDGHQPMSSGSGRFWISFNGEIFNHVELRQELMERGRRFRTNSDTEVILHLFEEHGADCVSLLNGDFAFAIWDGHERRMTLARDRMGVRPLYYASHRDTVFFASEVKAILRVPGIDAEIDPFALDQIFTLWAPVAPRTIFKNISELPPAHIMAIDANGLRSRPYWQLSFPDRQTTSRTVSMKDRSEELLDLLDDATRIRLRADVPVGAYLSGGLDSSIVSALAARTISSRLRTYSVTFASAEHDESSYQDEVVRALGTEHSSVECLPQDIARIFPDVVRHMETPVVRTAPAPLFMLSGLVRDHGFKVVLTGEGADEVFAGYDIFKEAAVRRFCARQPRSRFRSHLFRRLYPYLPNLSQQTPEYLTSFFCGGDDASDSPLFSHLPRFRSTSAAKIFFSGDFRATLGGFDAAQTLIDRLPADFKRWAPLHQAQYIETTFLLPGYILSSQGDRVAMAHGVEGRFPFLDHRVVEFAAKLPPGAKLKGLSEKHILREATKNLLPPSIAWRTKQPYRAPDCDPFSMEGAPDYVAEMLSPRAVAQVGIFSPQAVEKLHAKCRRQNSAGFRDSTAFVSILSTQLWQQAFGASTKYQSTYAA
ncbi:asparagine synthase (glutamine-hydrolyzing) [Microvirga mediterraneensis]|uniref:asparagine synthase (glutamine-hydrolyzing) n=1 Tax=Microvirga mediterraneensis TaxID=2754695 RepID=A0A838BPM7_9HYPH|nr:asparagine synthase (glutamine-hydrolyzing) [Microvirga mediterraneensis]MBA1157019.1 asparagine synthase (glutamine-hydrolyzing) [Microvirga mediterraneensis]